MLEIHRLRHLQWLPSAVVALATSPDGAAIAAARESGAIEVWKAAPGSVGWYCQLTVPGMQGAAISCLIWCSSPSSSQGRLFSSGLDGFITEWDLHTLQAKAQVESFGGSVWQIAAQPVQPSIGKERKRPQIKDESSDTESDSESEDEESTVTTMQQDIAAACDDGSVRLFTVSENVSGMTYKKAFPRVNGRILSVAWFLDGNRVFAGGSDGCIRCWDPSSSIELYRITVGIGGTTRVEELCIWSLLVLKNGTLVSGDSTGTTQFWDERGTLLDALQRHNADVLSLAATPSHTAVFAAGADGQVILYEHVSESKRVKEYKGDVLLGHADKWTYVGTKRSHSHDVRALTIAIPLPIDEGDIEDKPWSRPYKERKKWPEPDHRKWARPGIPMLVSGGNDAKMFAYPATEMMSYEPHDICTAPERPFVQIAPGISKDGNIIMMAQHSTFVDIWRVSSSNISYEDSVYDTEPVLGKRKHEEPIPNGNHKRHKEFSTRHTTVGNGTEHGVAKSGKPPVLLAKLKSKSAAHISCSAISQNGRFLAFSDVNKPRIFELKHAEKKWSIIKRNMPGSIPPAHRMLFTVDSSRLVMACPQSEILVLDVESLEVVHAFRLGTTDSPVTLLCASRDGQWLAAGSSSGNLIILNLETLRHHWSVPLIDGTPATAAVFRPGNSSVLIVTTAANKIHVVDIEAKELGRWSKVNHSNIPSDIREFPGGISGLTVSPSPKSTEIIAYSSRAMCLIDFSKPVEKQANGHTQNGYVPNGMNGNGKLREKKNFVVSLFKNPVLFVEYVSKASVLVVERPWLEVLQQLPAPVYRHLYGT